MKFFVPVPKLLSRRLLVDSAASYAGALLTPISVFVAVPVALRQLPEAEAGKFLVILSISRLIAGFDFGIAQLATPRLRSYESRGQTRRKFCALSVLALACISVLGAVSMSYIIQISSGLILQSFDSRDIVLLICLSFGFSLATFARELSGAVRRYRSAFLISGITSAFYLTLIFTTLNDVGTALGPTVAGYLITQSTATVLVSSLSGEVRAATTHVSLPKFSWRTAITMQAISLGNLATIQVPVVLASLLLNVEDVLKVAVAFQIASAVRLIGSSVSPFVLSQMSGLSSTDVFRMASRIRRYWILLLLASSVAGLLLASPVDRFLLADGSNDNNYTTVIIWGVVWGAMALSPLIATTAFRNLLQLQVEIILAMYSTMSVLLLALGMWQTRSASFALGMSMCSILLGAALAELLFSHFWKKIGPRTS